MSLNETVSAERKHIAFFGLRNAGKSSLVNAVTGQSLSLVSDVAGTTTDPVKKAMELLPAGPVVVIDTPGIDDEGELGRLRVGRSEDVLGKTDLAVFVTASCSGFTDAEQSFIDKIKERNIPLILVRNKADLHDGGEESGDGSLTVSAATGLGINELKNVIAEKLNAEAGREKGLLDGLVKAGDTVVLVTPIDSAAPKGRLILPQQQTLRALLDIGAVAVVTKESELAAALESLRKAPDLVITDSQAFAKVAAVVPEDVPLTSFSIIFARYKGDFDLLFSGAAAIDSIKDGDIVMISEGCTHHRQCGDIGTEKLPRWLIEYTGKKPQFIFTSGGEFDLRKVTPSLVIHCGGCMLTEREMRARLEAAKEMGIPVTNYGTAIAKMKGILERAVRPLKAED